MTNGLGLECQNCGFMGFECIDGFYYCQRCGSQVDGIMDTALDNDDMILTKENVGGLVQRRVPAGKTEQLSQSQPPSQFWETLQTQEDGAQAGDGVGPTKPADFPEKSRPLCYEDYYSEIRMRYVMGVQIMLQLQIKALVDKFNVSPIILDLVEPIWSKFIESTDLFADDWADEVIRESESQVQGEPEGVVPGLRNEAERRNFLVCHLAREPILSTDIIKWTLEGKLPYFAAFVEIEEQIGPPANACPLSSSRMFRPIHAITVQKMESLAASLANSIRLELPPVNFYAIASRYLRQLSLPVETILPHACRIYEWSMPSELWLSANEFRLPTRLFVLSILIVAIRILCNIHGFGKWEMSLSSDTKRRDEKKSKKLDVIAGKDEEEEFECNVDVNSGAELSSVSNNRSEPCASSQSGVSFTEPYNKLPPKQSNLDATDILHVLHSKYDKLIDTSDHGKDLEKYLEYCKDVVFAEVELSFEDHEEDKLMEDLWDFYQKEEMTLGIISSTNFNKASILFRWHRSLTLVLTRAMVLMVERNRGEHLIRRFAGRGNEPDPRDVKIASLKQRIQELEFPQLQQDSPAEEAETESNVWDDGSEDVNPFGRGNPVIGRHRPTARVHRIPTQIRSGSLWPS
nr:TATA box-binding protein-associated factor RNA polymerase I subunit B isoform X1 [Tanacetum cinerariifolium]